METLAKTVLFTCLLFAYVYADDGNGDDAVIYTFSVNKTFAVEPDSTETKIIVNGSILCKTVKSYTSIINLEIRTTYYVSVQSLNFYIDKGNSEVIDLDECSSFQNIRKELGETFVLSYRNGLFEYLQVPKNNENLSVNLKLLLGKLFQYNAVKLLPTRSNNDKQDTLYGICNVDYDVSRDISWGKLRFDINKVYDTNSCSKINQTGSLNDDLDDICNSIKEKNLEYDMKENLKVTYSRNQQTIDSVSIKEIVSFNPWRDSSASLNQHFSQHFEITKLLDSSLSTDLTDDNSDIVTSLRYSAVDKDLVDSNSDEPLQKTYSALACDPYNSNIHLEMYQRALYCNQ